MFCQWLRAADRKMAMVQMWCEVSNNRSWSHVSVMLPVLVYLRGAFPWPLQVSSYICVAPLTKYESFIRVKKYILMTKFEPW